MTEIFGVSRNGASEATEKFGVMLCGHGSRDTGAVAEFANLAAQLRARFDWPVEYGYLEFATPIIREGLEKLVAAGARHILAVPGMLFAAGHAKNDIPSVLNTWAASRPGLRIEYGRDLGIDPKMIAAAGARIREALNAPPAVSAHETLLVVVGRGASDPDANSNVAKVTRLLWEGFGFGWAETAYSGVTFPLVEPALEKAARLGFRRIVVFPYFLFTGILVDRIYAMTDAVAARHPEIAFLKAGYLNDHPLVLDTFVERVHEILQGQNLMNCQMCKYRAQVLGFEAEVGLPQESHHHHVEGISAGAHTHDAPPPPLRGRAGKGGPKREHHRDRHVRPPPPMPHAHVHDEERDFARSLRRDQTPAEALIWRELRAHRLAGLGFRRQVPIGRYVADFVCHETRLVVELDGEAHRDGAARDSDRDAWFRSRGYRTLRFSNDEALRFPEKVLETIRGTALEQRAERDDLSPLPNPPPQGGRERGHAHRHGDHDHSHPHPHTHDEPSPPLRGKAGEGGPEDAHHHPHLHDHSHPHTHHPYPHVDHPLGPRSMRRK